MMCSERELLLSDDHEGIIDLDPDLPVGTPAAVALGLDDPVFHVKVTPNRPDALGVRGIARDLAAKGLGTLKPLAVAPVAGRFVSPVAVKLEFAGDTSPCPLFVGRYFRGVANGPSPDWLARRLVAIGLRPISALVDITNYMTYRLLPPLACLRRRPDQGQYPRPPGAAGGDHRGARRQDLCARSRDDGDRR